MTQTPPASGAKRYLHTMVRVLDLDRAIGFYKLLGMTERRRSVVEGGRYTLVFMGFENDPEAVEIELTYNWDRTEPYVIGDGFGHFAVKVPDVAAVCAKIEKEGGQFGGKVTRAPGPVKFGTTIIAFVADADGYKTELIQK